MKTFAKVIVVLLIIIAIPLIVALFIKKDFQVSREIVINKPKMQVFDYIKCLKNQDNYSVWVMTDPNMKKSFTGTDGTTGFIYGWSGNKDAGEGEQEITKINEGERIDVEVRFKKPQECKIYCPMTTTSINAGQTKITWESKGTTSYPFNLMNPFMDKMLGKDMEKSLFLLKGILEKS